MTLSVRRSAAALAAGAALVLAGCAGTDGPEGAAGPDRAAVVDGQVIGEKQLQAATSEVNAMNPQLLQEKLTPTGTLTALVQAPVVLRYLEGKGVKVSDSVARQDALERGIADPADSTLEIIKLAGAISTAQTDGRLSEADALALTEQLRALDIVVNPRYGTYDPQSASVQLTTPGWVKPVDAPQ